MNMNKALYLAGICAAIVMVASGFGALRANVTPPDTLHSTLETIDIATKTRTVVYTAAQHFEAPNWTRDGANFLFNMEGRIYRLSVAGGTPAPSTPDSLPNATTITASRPTGNSWPSATNPRADRKSRVYIVPIAGGAPRLRHAECAVVLARLVARRKNPRLRRPARRQFRHLLHSRSRRRRDSPDHRPRPRRRPRILARRQIHLLQFRPHRHDADLAHEARRLRPGAGHSRRLQQLVPAHLARRPVDGLFSYEKASTAIRPTRTCRAAADVDER